MVNNLNYYENYVIKFLSKIKKEKKNIKISWKIFLNDNLQKKNLIIMNKIFKY